MLLIPAHAKINLCLAVRGRRGDGFHDIDSVALPIDWHDLVGIRLRPSATTELRLRVTGDDRSTPHGDDNLVVRAARAVAAVAGPLAADLWLEKRVPSEAGLGGGSADAAAVLRGCAALVGAGALGRDRTGTLDLPGLLGSAASLGSDVPMLVAGGPQRMRGRGEALTPLSAPALDLAVVIVAASSTAATYAAVKPLDFEDGTRTDAVAAALEAGERPDDDRLGSGLEAAACRTNPTLATRLLGLRAAVPEVRWHLTGSGGAAFAIADARAPAEQLASAARDAGFPARACRSIAG
jgi:4-diphosphocytidyl-2-C-methyl-D-erythritol kinase